MNLCEAGKFALIRPVGTTSRARAGAKTDAAQRAKVGYCACCTRAIHVAVRPMCALVAFDWPKSRGMALWKAR